MAAENKGIAYAEAYYEEDQPCQSEVSLTA